MKPLLSCRSLVVGYRKVPLLPPIDLTIAAGEFWTVIGRNGSGKTTLFKTLLGLLPQVSGEVVHHEKLSFAYVAQRLSFDDLYPVTARDVVQMGTIRDGRWWGLSRGHASIAEAMKSTSIESLADRPFRTLSEGQKQRVLFARMVVSGANLAVLDEPTAAMDSVAERETIALVDSLRSRFGIAILLVSHDLDLPRQRADRALFLDPDGRRCAVGSPDEIYAHEAFLARYTPMGAEETLPGQTT